MGLRVNILKLVGTGYKCIVPKRMGFKFLYLRVGFAAAELLYNSAYEKRVKLRARRQKILLLGFNKTLLANISQRLVNLRYPKCLYR
jgi:hypothetical protein